MFKIIEISVCNQDSTGTNVIYSNEVSFRIEQTDEKLPYIQIEKEARGKSLSEAKQRAEKIKYRYQNRRKSFNFR